MSRYRLILPLLILLLTGQALAQVSQRPVHGRVQTIPFQSRLLTASLNIHG